MSRKRALLVAGLPIVAALTVPVPQATAQPNCDTDWTGITICDCPTGTVRRTTGQMGCVTIPQMPASVPAGVTEASICADMRALRDIPKSGGDAQTMYLTVTNPELDKLTSGHVFGADGGNTGNGMNMSYSDAVDAVEAAVWHVCPELTDGIISKSPP